MIMRMLLLTMLLILTSCSYVHTSVKYQDRDKHYLDAQTIPPLKIPPGVTSNAITSYYPVSDHDYPATTKNISLVPPGLTGEQGAGSR